MQLLQPFFLLIVPLITKCGYITSCPKGVLCYIATEEETERTKLFWTKDRIAQAKPLSLPSIKIEDFTNHSTLSEGIFLEKMTAFP